MSQDFKLNFDDSRAGKQTGQETGDAQGESALYDTPGNVRNLCFVWPDGRMKFMNYAYLVSGNYDSNNGEILLEFPESDITIKGGFLFDLFYELMENRRKIISITETRYTDLNNNSAFISEIIET